MMVLGKVAVKKCILDQASKYRRAASYLSLSDQNRAVGVFCYRLLVVLLKKGKKKKREKDQEGDVQFWFCSLAENLVGPACHVTFPVMQMELLRIRQELILAHTAVAVCNMAVLKSSTSVCDTTRYEVVSRSA